MWGGFPLAPAAFGVLRYPLLGGSLDKVAARPNIAAGAPTKSS